MSAPRDGFAAACITRFEVNFDNAPMFVSRSEYIPVKHGRPNRLKKTIEPGVQTPKQWGTKKHSRAQCVGNQLSAKAMQSGSLLENRN